MIKTSTNKVGLAYFGLIFVVLFWGIVPPITKFLYNYYSPSINSSTNGLIAVIVLLIFSRKKLKLLNKSYFKIAIPTGIFMATASLMQKIGLFYTTPSKYAFLENLSCLVVPILMFWFTRKKPTILKIIAAIICLLSAMILSNIWDIKNGTFNFGNFNIGDILCALAGIFYGVNIAGTGAFAKKLDAGLYVSIQMAMEFIISLIVAIVLNNIIVDGAPIETLKFSFEPIPLLIKIAVAVVSYGFCWLIRTNSMKYVNASFVAIIMPFAAVISSITAIILGQDTISLSLIVGAVVCLTAIAISTIDDILENKRLKKENNELAK